MRYLQILNWVLFAAGALMTLVLSVVTLMMGIYRERVAEIGGSLESVVAATVAFAVFGSIAGVAAWGLYRGAVWKWLAQGGLAVALFGLVQFVRQLG